MARRGHIGGGRQRLQFDPSAFLQRGGGDNKDDTAMAMALLGYGKGSSPEDRALDAQKQAWAEKYQAGQLNIEELKQKAAEAEYQSLAEARKAGTASEAQKRIDEAAKEAAREREEAAKLDYLKTKADRDAAVEVFKNAVEHGNLKEGTPQYEILAEAAMPGYKEKSTAAKRAIFEENVNTALTKYQAADPKKKAAIDKDPAGSGIPADVYSEMLKRRNVNVAPPQGTATAPGEGRLPLSSLNAPTAPPGSDIFSEKGVRIGPPLVDARDYSKFPGSVEDLIRASSSQPLPESRFAKPRQSAVASPPVVSAPPQIYMPRASQESIAPGLEMPREYGVIPEAIGQYQPGAAFSRQGLPDLKYIPDAVESDTVPADFGDITSALGDLNLAPARNLGDILGSAKVDQLLQLLRSGGTGIPGAGAGLYDVSGPTTEAPPPYIPMPQGPATGFPWPQQSRLQPFPG